MVDASLAAAVEAVPPGAWAIGVSGGADSVALLSLLRDRCDLNLTIAHFNHEMRGAASAADAAFVAELARDWSIPLVVAQRHAMEAAAGSLPANRSARLRALRLAFFRDVVSTCRGQGVILAHHADDQAETVFLRLLRRAAPAGLAAMSPRTVIGGMTVLRPLLGVRRAVLRTHLTQRNIGWREDPSNESPDYRRSRVRRVLAQHTQLHEPLLAVAEAAARYRAWLHSAAPALGESFQVSDVRGLPRVLQQEALRRWLHGRGARAEDLTPGVIDRLEAMINDAASPMRQHFPGSLLVRRRGGKIFIDR